MQENVISYLSHLCVAIPCVGWVVYCSFVCKIVERETKFRSKWVPQNAEFYIDFNSKEIETENNCDGKMFLKTLFLLLHWIFPEKKVTIFFWKTFFGALSYILFRLHDLKTMTKT